MKVKEYFKALTIMHFALVLGQLFFMLVAIFLSLSGNINGELNDMRNLFLIIVAFVTLAGVYGGNFIYNKQLEAVKQKKDYKQQFTDVKALIITRLALLEAPSFLAIVFYILTGSWMFLIFVLLVVMLFLKLKPNKEKIISELELSEEIKKLLENPETIISYDTEN
ncbi:MAG: hypothetical protein JXR51_14080 [Bacteroidales bacterium]|nr:hypothetical protein [Bacteroidales bacterium]MBN2758297.1 hypothetical protein [Bacteroidales bacterium]